VQDRTISTFARGYQPASAGINTFLKAPYLEDVKQVVGHDVAPFDMGTTFRPGARWAPQAVRRISALYDGYNLDMAVDLLEELDIVDVGDVFVIPSNIEKTFDQIDKAVHHLAASGAFPVIIGGDHSIGYPDVKGVARHVDGYVGIIHLDRHIDLAERDMDVVDPGNAPGTGTPSPAGCRRARCCGSSASWPGRRRCAAWRWSRCLRRATRATSRRCSPVASSWTCWPCSSPRESSGAEPGKVRSDRYRWVTRPQRRP
jgi:Arginase family